MPACLQEEALAQVQSILGCNTTTARALLIYFSWDAEAVLGGCWLTGWLPWLPWLHGWWLDLVALIVWWGAKCRPCLPQTWCSTHHCLLPLLHPLLQARWQSGNQMRCTSGRACCRSRKMPLQQAAAAAAARGQARPAAATAAAAERSLAWCACLTWRQRAQPPWSAATPSATTAGGSTCGAAHAMRALH